MPQDISQLLFDGVEAHFEPLLHGHEVLVDSDKALIHGRKSPLVVPAVLADWILNRSATSSRRSALLAETPEVRSRSQLVEEALRRCLCWSHQSGAHAGGRKGDPAGYRHLPSLIDTAFAGVDEWESLGDPNASEEAGAGLGTALRSSLSCMIDGNDP
ncbi:MAG: hypothetical protein WAP47_11165 [Candidatus Rokuibacteriota bacterium]